MFTAALWGSGLSAQHNNSDAADSQCSSIVGISWLTAADPGRYATPNVEYLKFIDLALPYSL
jgi:hypothetical protein